MTNQQCALCRRLEAVQNGAEPLFIHEFENSVLLLGDHQYFKGYSILVAKNCVRDMVDLSQNEQQLLMQEVMQSAQAIHQAFKPWKLNYASLGNQCQHIHWHIFPRYETEPDLVQNPWFNQTEFAKHPSLGANAHEVIGKIRLNL